MNQVIMLPPEGLLFDSQPSPTFALTAFLPIVSLPEQYPALPKWVYEVCDRFDPATRQEFRMLTVFTYRAFANLLAEESHLESVERFLQDLSALEAEELQVRVASGLASPDEDRLPDLQDREGLRALIVAAAVPVGDEQVAVADVERAVHLLQHPPELKQFLIGRFRELWDHLQPHWEQLQAAARQQAVAARSHFGAGGLPEVFRTVTGRSLPPSIMGNLPRIRRVIFSPLPFYGPYCVCSFRPRSGEFRVGYGGGIQPTLPSVVGDGAETIPGGMLPALEALADETRLQILSLVRDAGQGCAQDFMRELGLSQPATSRHLRLLETTGLVQVERIEGVKWYRINPVRAAQVAAAIQVFLTAGGVGR